METQNSLLLFFVNVSVGPHVGHTQQTLNEV